MIRVAVFADTLGRAEGIAKLLAEDERLEIVAAGAWLRPRAAEPMAMVDVVVAVGIDFEQSPREGPPVIMLSNAFPARTVFSRNVRAWLPENASPAEIAAAIAAAAQEFTVLTRAQVRQWGRADLASQENAMAEALTAREAQVLRMMADGLGNKQIAARLDLSDHTAKFHVAQILAKLGAGSRAEAVAIGMRRGWVPI